MKSNAFQKLALATLVTVLVLILVGAMVRAVGAGMGCPDWPRCFDRWVPPTALAQVPVALRPWFNVRLAWIEYVNRLLGMTTGLLVLATMVVAIRQHRRSPLVVTCAVGAFVGTSLAGWLGKVVVERQLAAAMITLHLLVAYSVVALLVAALVASRWPDARPVIALPPARQRVLMVTLVTTVAVLVQVTLGTQVRAAVEAAARSRSSPPAWLAQAGQTLPVHEALAFVVLVLSFALAVLARRPPATPLPLRVASTAVAALAAAQVVAGAGLGWTGMHGALRVAHVGLASGMLGALVGVAMMAWRLPGGGGTVVEGEVADGEVAPVA